MLAVPWSNPERAVTAGFVGRWTAALLLAAIDGEPAHGLTTVPCGLICRASSGPRTAQTEASVNAG